MLTGYINQFNKLATPFYFYDVVLLQRTLQLAQAAARKHDFTLHYALKANSNDRILTLIRDNGFGADCVSGNEVKKALEQRFKPDHVVFAGVGKSDSEMEHALRNNIFCFNCESVEELDVLNQVASNLSTKAPVALRLNPNLDANTHHYITTGLEENKFGIGLWQLDEALDKIKSLSNVEFVGLHFHIGSQITDLQVFKSLCVKVNDVLKRLHDRRMLVQHLNLGGGLGVNYHQPDAEAVSDFETYFGLFTKFIDVDSSTKVHLEPGRALVAQCGSLITRVLFVKKGMRTNFVIADAGMTELIRPALYQSYHRIDNLSNVKGATQPYDVVGPVCESSDCFAKAMLLPETKRGDLLAIRTTGAYGESMASRYNLRDIAPSVFSDQLL
jgi:diaminopimelate decarboxylase